MVMASRKRDVATTKTPQRRFVLGASAIVIVAVMAAAYLWLGRSQADLRPINGQNVLLVTIDTLRADALGAYGGPAATPALDRLAADGVRFDFAHAQSVLTLPSHATILTGEYPFQHGLRGNSGFRLPPNTRTMATMLKQSGYATAAFVGAFPLHAQFGLNVGFDVYDDYVGTLSAADELATPERPASVVVPLARSWIAARGDTALAGAAARPWFTWVHVFDPHAPYRPPPPFDTQYAGRPYYGEVSAVDAALMPLLDDVRRSNRPTLVIVTGDHGESLGEHGEETHGVFAYESTLRIPLIIAELGGASSGRSLWSWWRGRDGEVSAVGARHIDILPTILDAIGVQAPVDLPGRTLLPRAERGTSAAPRPMYFEAMSGMLSHGWAPLTGVLIGRDKFIDLPIAERYDLAGDSREQVNLAGRDPARDSALAAALASFSAALPSQDRVIENRETRDRLRALGYVSVQASAKARYTEADDPKNLVDLDIAIHRAISAFGDGRIDDAADIYKQVIARRPDMAFPYRRLALIYWQSGNAPGAVEVLRRAVAHGVTDPRAVAQLGEYLTDTGRVAEGISLLEPLAADPAADADTVNALAIAYARAGRAMDARGVFERLLGLMPGSSAPLENLGMLALEQGDVRAARAYFDRAVAVEPRSSRAYAGVGATAFQGGDRKTAYAAWTRAVELDPANFEALFSLGVNLARDGRMDAARPYLDQFRRTAPPASYTNQLREVARLLLSGR